MEQVARDMLELVRAALWGTEVTLTEEADWNGISKEMYCQGVLLLVGDILPVLRMQEGMRQGWQMSVQQGYCSYLRMMAWQSEVSDMLEAAGIRWALLKGCAAAMHYPNPTLRTMGDMDILVEPEQFTAAAQLLDDAGFVRFRAEYEKEDGRHISFSKGSFVVELHRYYTVSQSQQAYMTLNQMLLKGMEKAELVTVGQAKLRILPPLENGLVLLEHLAHHVNSGFGLRQLLDFTMYLKACLQDENQCAAFMEAAASVGLDTLARVAAQTSTLYLGMPSAPWFAGVKTEVCEKLMSFVMRKGNFGMKNNHEDERVVRVMNRFRGGLASWWANLKMTGEYNWKAMQKHPWLKPFRGIYQLFRYARQVLQMKKGSTILRKMKTSQKEKALFKELGLEWHHL